MTGVRPFVEHAADVLGQGVGEVLLLVARFMGVVLFVELIARFLDGRL